MARSVKKVEEEVEDTGLVVHMPNPAEIEMPATEEEFLTVIAHQFDSMESLGRLCYWRIGKMLSEAQKDEEVYGAEVVKKAAEACGRDARLLWDALKMYNMYSEYEIIKDMKVGWASIRKLISIKDTKVRERLRKKAEKDQLSFREVQDLVKKEKEKSTGTKNKASERSAKQAISPLAYLKKVHKNITEYTETMQALMPSRVEHYPIMMDEDRTSEKEFEDMEAEIARITRDARVLMKFMEANVVAIETELENYGD